MQQELELKLLPEQAADMDVVKKEAARQEGIKLTDISDVELLRRSVDARNRQPKVLLKIRLYIGEKPVEPTSPVDYKNVASATPVVIIGAGPAGLFAALRMLELELKPIILERGKNVRDRRRDLAAINKDHIVNPDSNYCFGEGGAGTYSDGKLYTRSIKRGNVRKVLEMLVHHGASQDILIDAHPHIGTNKLPSIIASIREVILAHGGEIHFNQRVTDLQIVNGAVATVITADGTKFDAQQVILATGHSARDMFELLWRKNIQILFKPFALGVRVEHPQSLIDRLQYHCEIRSEYLPPAAYSLVHQDQSKGVYSFCMCPGGIIAPCATNPGEIVTNGWSPSKRNNPFANSGIVTSIEEAEVQPFKKQGPLAGMFYQQQVEQKAWEAGGKTQTAPAQRLTDFINKKHSQELPKTSYQPGVVPVMLNDVLPQVVYERLRSAFRMFGKKMPGYLTSEAVVVATESRTSSPVRIPRDPETLQHPHVKGLFPCGEGAGYAGGIVSAAMDGMKCAEKCVEALR